MTANADLITAERNNVLLVPNRAITVDREAGAYYVNQIEGEGTSRVKVRVGLRDSQYTEITSGLQEGDSISIAEAKDELMFGPRSHP
jgi:multidrug efflux pump subunit AcrA (membrane-fusion protein)